MDVPPLTLFKGGGHTFIIVLKPNVDWKILFQIKKAKDFSAIAKTSASASVSINACTSASASATVGNSAWTGASARTSANIFPKFIEVEGIPPPNLFRVHGHLCATFIGEFNTNW